MNRHIHWRKRLKYLNAVADYLRSLGYEVETPNYNSGLLDVWGRCNGRKCFVEIYLHALDESLSGIHGIWGQGENEDEELFLSHDPDYGLDTRFAPMHILDGLKPMKRVRRTV